MYDSPRKARPMGFWNFFWLLIWSFFFVAYLMALFHIFGDLFRDRQLGGWSKALWLVFLLIAPFLGALVYLIARGGGMARRQAEAMRQAQAETEQYIQSVAAQRSPTDQVTSAKALLDDGSITQIEYEKLKAKALA
jgi:ABC-type multidrug transport system fused ATPase/permease subunit